MPAVEWLTVCSRKVQELFPQLHEVFCNGECGKPQREDYASGYDYFKAMERYLKNKTRKDKRDGTYRKPEPPASPYTQAKII